MKIICSNTQSLKKPLALFKVKFLSIMHKRNLIFLLETLVNDNNFCTILPLMGFELYYFVSPANHLGGPIVLWNNGNIHASILAIHMMVHDTKNAKSL